MSPSIPEAAPLFAALGDPTRLALVTALAGGPPRSLGTLAAELPVTRQAVAKHLRVLEAAGLVDRTRSGRQTLFTLRPGQLGALREVLDAVERDWAEARGRLKAHIEG